MSVLSKALRVAVVVGVFGCSTNKPAKTWSSPDAAGNSTNEMQTSENSQPSAGEIAANVLAPSTAAAPEQLLSRADGGIDLQLERGSDYTKVILGTKNADSPYEVASMTEPPRLVVDLIGEATPGNRAIPVESDTFLRSVRLGSHADRTRVVLDLTQLASNTDQTYRTVDRENGNVAITFRSVNGTAAVAPQANLAEPVAASAPVEVAANTDVIAPVAVTEERPVAQAKVEVASEKAVVESINFTKTRNSTGEVAVAINGKAPFELRQTAPSEYALVIRGATATDEAKYPQLAAPGSPGIRSTRTLQDANNVTVRMFVDQGVELRAFTRDSKILVLAHAAGDTAQDARAQLQPEQPKAAEPAPVAADAGAAEGVDVGGGDETARRNPTGIPSADGSKIYTGRLISLDLQETDIDNALRIIAEVSNLNIIASDDVTGKVTLRLVDVPWDQALDVILKTNGLDQVTEGNVIRIAPVDKLRQEREALREAKKAAENLEDLKITYNRISYARSSDLKEQIESVLSERGSVAVDERTNQLIVKDITKGQESALALIKKLDLRTPQVLLETQVVEASRGILRDLGFQWNYSYRASPATGNALGYNFPNSLVVGGSAAGSGGELNAVNFPAAIGADAGSAISAVLDSADGAQMLALRLSALEQEGRVRVVSRPQVATINNKEAEIKSVETVRVRLPDSGLSVATGQGASSSGGGSSAFQEIDVGIQLRVTPQASPDYYVLLDVYAKSSTFGDRIVDDVPSTLEREATSSILVKSGQTFALGGVYRIEERNTVSGVPFLKDIPVLGTFFKRNFVDNGDEELIFFITPHIVEGSFDPSLM